MKRIKYRQVGKGISNEKYYNHRPVIFWYKEQPGLYARKLREAGTTKISHSAAYLVIVSLHTAKPWHAQRRILSVKRCAETLFPVEECADWPPYYGTGTEWDVFDSFISCHFCRVSDVGFWMSCSWKWTWHTQLEIKESLMKGLSKGRCQSSRKTLSREEAHKH